jgi:hypothetical protein
MHFPTGADLGCPETDDNSWALPVKTKAMCRWAIGQGFGRIFKCDDDVMVRPEFTPHLVSKV